MSSSGIHTTFSSSSSSVWPSMEEGKSMLHSGCSDLCLYVYTFPDYCEIVTRASLNIVEQVFAKPFEW